MAMNFGIAADFAEVAAVLQIIACGAIVIAAFAAGWTARGCQ
jgi:hypothetical protein